MLKKKFRGLSRKEVAYAQKKGQTMGNRFFAVWTLAKKTPSVQFALVISKRVSKKAVVRNKLRRRIYEIIRNNYTGWENPRIIIISAKQVCAEASFEEIKENLLKIIVRNFKF